MFTPKAIKIKIKSTHLDYTNKNFYNYDGKTAIDKGSPTWTSPFRKPILVLHKKESDPLGRVTDYKVCIQDTKNEPKTFIELIADITDSDAIAKILDGRYLTVSVGSRSSKVICSECDSDLTVDGLCKHKKGSRASDGSTVYWKIFVDEYTECSVVNEPADPWAKITMIDVGSGWMAIQTFIDKREAILSELEKNMSITLEDSIMDINNATLSAEARNRLPDSAFCYVSGSGDKKMRKFPVHDPAHVKNALARLPQAKGLSESTKSKIRACVLRRAKRFGITASEDEIKANPDLLTFRIDDEYSPEEHAAIVALFAEDENFDVPQDSAVTDAEQKPATTDSVTTPAEETVESLKVKIDAVNQLLNDEKAKLEASNTKIAELHTILADRENEINRYLDKLTVIEQDLRNTLIGNIVDLKGVKEDEVKAVSDTLKTRKIESLKDTLVDLRAVKTAKSSPKVTINDTDKHSDKVDDKSDRYSVFYVDNTAED